MAWYTAFIPEIVGYVSNYFTKKQERQLALETGTLKLKQSKQTGEHEVTMTDAEGEAVLARGLENSWKDEYVTIIITLPIPMIMVGAMLETYDPESKVLTGVVNGLKRLEILGLDWGFLTSAVVLAAVGLKIWRAR